MRRGGCQPGIRIRIDRPQQRRAGAGEVLRGQPQAEFLGGGRGDLAQVAEEVLQLRLTGRMLQLGPVEAGSPRFVGDPAQPQRLRGPQPERPVLRLLLGCEPPGYIRVLRIDAHEPILLGIKPDRPLVSWAIRDQDVEVNVAGRTSVAAHVAAPRKTATPSGTSRHEVASPSAG